MSKVYLLICSDLRFNDLKITKNLIFAKLFPIFKKINFAANRDG